MGAGEAPSRSGVLLEAREGVQSGRTPPGGPMAPRRVHGCYERPLSRGPNGPRREQMCTPRTTGASLHQAGVVPENTG